MIFDMSSLTPKDHTTLRWVILHQFENTDNPDYWSCTWHSELVVEGTPSEKEQEIEAHKALDRSYGSPFRTKLLKQTYRNIRTIEEIPAMWEAKV